MPQSFTQLRQSNPQVVDYESANDAQGIVYISIRKDAPRQAFKVARPSAMFNPLARVTIVVDDDIDVLDSDQVRFALGSRWQPATASEIIENRPAFPLDPAAPDAQNHQQDNYRCHTTMAPKKVVHRFNQELNRVVFERAEPDALARVRSRWPDKLSGKRG